MTPQERLQRLFDLKGVGWTEAAKLAGFPRQTMHQIMSGRVRNPRVGTVTKIVETLGFTMFDYYAKT